MRRRRTGSSEIAVPVRQLDHAVGLPLPDYQTEGAAGFDLVAAVPEESPVTLSAGARALVPTGLVIELPPGVEAQVRPRSGLALRHGLTVLNSPGTIDSDYRGEVQVILVNLGDEPFVVRRGERIAQMVVAPVSRARLAIATKLSKTKRGAGGFGSTGTRAATSSRSAAKPMKKSKKVVSRPARRKSIS